MVASLLMGYEMGNLYGTLATVFQVSAIYQQCYFQQKHTSIATKQDNKHLIRMHLNNTS